MASIPHQLFQQPWPDGEYRFFQLGFVVDDLFGAAARWAHVFGIGPFHAIPRTQVPCTYRGTESELDVQVAVAQAGPVQIELIKQFSEGPSVYRDLVAKGESGFHQLCTVTLDYDATKAHYESLGYELACEFRVDPHTVYFDTVRDFGFFTEVVEASDYLRHFDRIAKTCAEWDGTDPVRIITRDGYRIPTTDT
jgi:hypothetical protein